MPAIIDPIGPVNAHEESGAILQNLARKMGCFGSNSAGGCSGRWGFGAMVGPSR
jgi:hypothetical protein